MHAVCATAHAKIDGHSCRLTDGIRRERVKVTNILHLKSAPVLRIADFVTV